MNALTAAVHELTKPWNEILTPDTTGDGYTVIEHEPRIHMLRNLIASNAGGTTSGRSLASTRNLVNIPAFDLWQRIDEQTRSALLEAGKKPRRDLADALDQLGTDGDALRATNDMTEQHHARLTGRVARWKDEIDNMFDPPTRKEIKAACPVCDVKRVATDDGETWAIFAYYWRDQEPAARCQACGKHWQGERDLLELGFSIGANVDHDELRAMGIG